MTTPSRPRRVRIVPPKDDREFVDIHFSAGGIRVVMPEPYTFTADGLASFLQHFTAEVTAQRVTLTEVQRDEAGRMTGAVQREIKPRLERVQ
ncbi:MAG: hypothetical protein AB1736_00050 [Chloroflexota bacterium]